jgi:hypothetical protein
MNTNVVYETAALVLDSLLAARQAAAPAPEPAGVVDNPAHPHEIDNSA